MQADQLHRLLLQYVHSLPYLVKANKRLSYFIFNVRISAALCNASFFANLCTSFINVAVVKLHQNLTTFTDPLIFYWNFCFNCRFLAHRSRVISGSFRPCFAEAGKTSSSLSLFNIHICERESAASLSYLAFGKSTTESSISPLHFGFCGSSQEMDRRLFALPFKQRGNGKKEMF